MRAWVFRNKPSTVDDADGKRWPQKSTYKARACRANSYSAALTSRISMVLQEANLSILARIDF